MIYTLYATLISNVLKIFRTFPSHVRILIKIYYSKISPSAGYKIRHHLNLVICKYIWSRSYEEAVPSPTNHKYCHKQCWHTPFNSRLALSQNTNFYKKPLALHPALLFYRSRIQYKKDNGKEAAILRFMPIHFFFGGRPASSSSKLKTARPRRRNRPTVTRCSSFFLFAFFFSSSLRYR